MTDDLTLLRRADLTATPWKNSGGITREIARASRGDRMIWRLSMAEVESEGPFSDFTGYARVLTVIRGGPMRLQHAGGTLEAAFGKPVRFDGALAVSAILPHGPVEDFNVIYDPDLCAGDVTVSRGPLTRMVNATCAIHALEGPAQVGSHRVDPGDTSLIRRGTAALRLSAGATALLVELAPLQDAPA